MTPSLLALALTFPQPIDQRFFRRKYDAAKVLEQFAQRAQQQADLDALGANILGVVQGTLEPERVTLWLREP